ncbi:C40 family peptidase [Clostridium sp. 'White wine YQ']|uniref:C40 family peptidase n=1 Tax=Clostridium sp. 'White wine YQ' TaxID=3027474 RepID=UPI0023653EF8|nr:C40 family peptidase [Clostridium sp. 'White wine YQ']MDD7796171.1 SH3 domain-containing protein [Clostridium sp. 'White wine YQ']
MDKKKIVQLLMATAATSTGVIISNHAAYAATNTTSVANIQQFTKKGQVINVSTNLRVRSGAGASYSIIGYLVNGQTFSILGSEGDWYNIQYDGRSGYVSKDYVKEVSSGGVVTTPTNNIISSSSKGEVVNISSSLRIRSSNSTNSSVVGYLNNGQTFDIKGKSGDWYSIQANGISGYVHKDYVKEISTSSGSTNPPVTTTPTQTPSQNTGSKKGVVYNVNSNLRLRSKASTGSDSRVVAYLLPGATFDVLGMYGDWYNVNYNGNIGYLLKDYVKLVDGTSYNNSSDANNSNTPSNPSAYNKILSSLKAQIGSPYVYGGAGELLTTAYLNTIKQNFSVEASRGVYDLAAKYVDKGYRAFDCSGFVQWGYKQAGITIGRTTWDQINNGVEVSVSDAKPGDLLFYSDISHVGMYIGNGQWIESPNSKDYVKIVNVNWSKIGRVRRILK